MRAKQLRGKKTSKKELNQNTFANQNNDLNITFAYIKFRYQSFIIHQILQNRY